MRPLHLTAPRAVLSLTRRPQVSGNAVVRFANRASRPFGNMGDLAMSVKRRVFMSLTHDTYLDDRQNNVKWGIVQRVIDAGYEPHLFFPAVPSRFAATVHREVPWTADKVREAVGGAVGAVMLGFPRWKYGDDAHASEFTHYEAGVAHTTGIPMLMVLEQGIRWRGAFDQSSAQICEVPQTPMRRG